MFLQKKSKAYDHQVSSSLPIITLSTRSCNVLNSNKSLKTSLGAGRKVSQKDPYPAKCAFFKIIFCGYNNQLPRLICKYEGIRRHRKYRNLVRYTTTCMSGTYTYFWIVTNVSQNSYDLTKELIYTNLEIRCTGTCKMQWFRHFCHWHRTCSKLPTTLYLAMF